MSLFKSKSALIDSCEIQITWNGIAAIHYNGDIDDLYSFRDALMAVGSTAKLAIIEKAVALYESTHGRRPDQDEAYDIGDEHSSELNGLDNEYYSIGEDLQALCLQYVRLHPEEVEFLKADAAVSEAATNLLTQLP